jgi:hypothetical protein
MTKLGILSTFVSVLTASAAFTQAGVAIQETAQFAGTYTYNAATGVTTFAGPHSAPAPAIVSSGPAISAIPGTANAAFSLATSEAPIFGDDYLTSGTGPGPLTSIRFSLFNSSSTASGTPTPITTANAVVKIYDESQVTALPLTQGLLATVNASFNFGATPLAPGFFSILQVTGLDAQNITLPNGFTLFTQQITPVGSTRIGIVSVANAGVTAGTTGGTDFYQKGNVTAEGFYTSGTTQINASFEAVVAPEPVSITTLAAAGLFGLGRRRRQA